MENIETQFAHAMIGVYETAKKHNYNATYFKRMIDQYGGLQAAKRLLATSDIQTGLMELWSRKLLDTSMEAIVLQERFQSLFTEAEIAEARRRLTELDYFK